MSRSEEAEARRRGVAGDGSHHADEPAEPMSKAHAAQLLGVREADIAEVRIVDDGDLVVHASGRGTVIPLGGGSYYDVEKVPAPPSAKPEPKAPAKGGKASS
jgi:hypothetical protein